MPGDEVSSLGFHAVVLASLDAQGFVTIHTLGSTTPTEKVSPDSLEAYKPAGIVDQSNSLLGNYSSKLTLATAESRAAASSVVQTVTAMVGAAIAVSLIPFQSNFGSVLAGNALHSLIKPMIERGISKPIDEGLRQYLRYEGLNPRILLKVMEAGLVTESDLVESAILNDLKDGEIAKLTAYARLLKYNNDNASDLRLLREFQHQQVLEVINTGRAYAAGQIAQWRAELLDLRAEQRRLKRESRTATPDQLAILKQQILDNTKQIAVIAAQIEEAQILEAQIPVITLQPLANAALQRLKDNAALLTLPPPEIVNALTVSPSAPGPGDLVTQGGGGAPPFVKAT